MSIAYERMMSVSVSVVGGEYDGWWRVFADMIVRSASVTARMS